MLVNECIESVKIFLKTWESVMNLYVSCSNSVQTVVNTTAIFWAYVTQICDLKFLVLLFLIFKCFKSWCTLESSPTQDKTQQNRFSHNIGSWMWKPRFALTAPRCTNPECLFPSAVAASSLNRYWLGLFSQLLKNSSLSQIRSLIRSLNNG